MIKLTKKDFERQKIDFKYNFKLYLKFLNNYKLLAVSVIILVLLLEGTRLVDKFLFKIIIDRGTEFMENTLTAPLYMEILIWAAVIYASVSVFGFALRWVRGHLVNRLDGNLIFDLKKEFYSHILRLSHKFHTTHKTGALISRLIRGAAGIDTMTDFVIYNTLPLIFQFIIVGTSLAYFDIRTGIVVLTTAIIFITWSFWIQQVQKKANVAANIAEDTEKAMVADTFTNIDSIKYFGKEDFVEKDYRKLSNNVRSTQIKHWDYSKWLESGQAIILMVGAFFMVYFPLQSFLAGNITLGTLVFIYTIYGNLADPLYGFAYGMRNFYRAMANFEDLFQYRKIKNEIVDSIDAENLRIDKGNIEFKNVDFSYKKRTIFKNFNLVVPAKTKVALVGHSGSGKSTLVKLLYRFYDTDKGEIKIDDKNINKFKQESLRSELSIVPQEAILFDDTIYNNIAFSNPRASKAEVMKAIKFAQLDKVIAEFPYKESTIVGERGIRLSGGEKQRVSIARAILANKKVLVLDEATSSLDSKTEHDIQEDLKRLMQGRTSIIIAHRLSTIMHADVIVVLDKGKIVQIGHHKELIKKKGVYRELWNLQRGGYIGNSDEE